MNNNNEIQKEAAPNATQAIGKQPLASNAQSKFSSNQGSSSSGIGSSWATTISQYLLQRSQQTQLAYNAQLQPHAMDDDHKDSQDWLFETLFEVLVQRLEEGHTVLVLEDNCSTIQSNDTELFTWQQQLLQPLLQPLLIAVEETSDAVIGLELLEQEVLWDIAMRQSTLLEYEKQVLRQRYSACVQLYNCLKQRTAISKASAEITPVENSLSKFIDILNNQKLGIDDYENFIHQSEFGAWINLGNTETTDSSNFYINVVWNEDKKKVINLRIALLFYPLTKGLSVLYLF